MKCNQKNTKYRKNSGFTLIELIVSVGLFAIVMTVSIGALLVVIDANAKAQSLNVAMTNVSFLVDSMTRDIRTGYSYYCNNEGAIAAGSPTSLPAGARNCVNGDTAIVFNDGESGVRKGYRLVGGEILMKENAGEWVSLTGNSVEIDTISTFTVTNSEPGTIDGGLQPKASLLIRGKVFHRGVNPTLFSIQSEVTQRVLDF